VQLTHPSVYQGFCLFLLRFFKNYMDRIFLAAIFLSAINLTFGQELTFQMLPYSEEHSASVSDIMRSFEAPASAAVVDDLDEHATWSTVENFAFGKDRGSMPMINDLSALHPYFRQKVEALIAACEAKGIHLALVETYRTRAKQNEYRSMGRIYTRSGGGRSKHQYGLAVDLVPIVDSLAVWHDPILWRKIGMAGERLGLRWGGRWRHPYDPGHFEWTGGLTSPSLEKGLMPHVSAQQFPCLNDELSVLREYWAEWENEQSTLVQSRAGSTAAMK
jgi:hypothetical protein